MKIHRPGSLGEACDLLSTLGAAAIPLGGGTDVLVDVRRGALRPEHLVSLSALPELRGITVECGWVRIGAMVTVAQLERSEEVRAHRPELLDAAGVFGTPQVRARATIGGNLCTAASCADFGPILLALEARLSLAGPGGAARDIPLGEFFADHRKTRRAVGEVLVDVRVPVRMPGDGAAYAAFGLREANFITVAGVAAALRAEEGVCRKARLALGAVAPTPLLVVEAGGALVGTAVEEEEVAQAAQAAATAAAPISDVRGSAEHRRDLVRALSRRAIAAAWRRAS